MKINRIKLLIADDSVLYRAQIKSAAALTEDIDVIAEAADGIEAVELVQRFLPDVLLLDAVLPRLDGLGVIERIRALALERPPHILLVTYAGQEIVEELAIERGVDMCINRSVNFERLCLYMRACVRQGCTSMNVKSIERYAQVVGELLDHIGMGRHLDGYGYLRYGVALACTDGTLLRGITKRLYPMTASHFDSDTRRVERSIRHAIETTFNAGDYKAIYEVFGNTIDPQRGKPTNGEFIALLAETARLQMRRRGL